MHIRPTILLPGTFSQDDLGRLRKENKIWKIVDIYDSQIQELAEVYHADGDAHKRKDFIAKRGKGDLVGAWVYYPWSGVLMHCAGEDDLFALRTNRNKNLVTKEEQAKLSKAVVSVAGMSVGSGIALACVYSGMSNAIHLSDFDELSTTNLNRLRESLQDVGVLKTELAARHVYEINPFADVKSFGRVSQENIDGFLDGASILFDEIDDFKMKIRLRLHAKAKRIPVVMMASLGDSVVVDVERYDMEPGLPLLNGLLGDLPEEILKSDVGEKEEIKYAMEMVGVENIPTRALGTLLEINKTLLGRHQLYGTVTMDGGLGAYLVRRIVLGLPLPSGRTLISLDKDFNLDPVGEDDRGDILARLKALIS